MITNSHKYFYIAGAGGFDFQLSTKIIFGEGSARRLSGEVQQRGKSAVLIVTSRGMSERSSLKGILTDLGGAGIRVNVFSSTPPEPSVEDVAKCIEFAMQAKPDLVVGIGGGSAMDVAKKTALEIGAPKIMIPTTAGSGSEVTYNSVLMVEGRKKSFSDIKLAADAAIVDPDLLTTMPPSVMVCSAMDAMAHAVESYGARKGNNITRALALEAYLLTRDNIGSALSGEAEGRRGIAMGSLMAGMALTGTGTTLGHALAYPLSNRGMTHGQSLAIVLPYLLKINRFDADHADELKSFRRKYCAIPEIAWEISEMAAEVAVDQRHLANNPVDVTLQEIIDIYTGIQKEA
ncbi:MAG: iron-containing alcohol dehydrogenase [Dehalococcoidia bacterium]|nr:iron-containing alcohol dehydrogenase [Dehalococcoidia bacterium]